MQDALAHAVLAVLRGRGEETLPGGVRLQRARRAPPAHASAVARETQYATRPGLVQLAPSSQTPRHLLPLPETPIATT